MRITKKRAFTLIELLVVITIIGILAVGGINIYTTQIQKARDSKRVKDIKILASGVEQYILDNGKPYPGQANATAARDNANIQNFRDAHKHYVPNIQNIYDPRTKGNRNCKVINRSNTECVYRYRNNLDGYKLATMFESITNICLQSEDCFSTQDGGIYGNQFEIWTVKGLPTEPIGTIRVGSVLKGLDLYESN